MWRDLLESDAWHDAGINVRRFVEFLQIEEMKHRPNGQLLAPYNQLVKFGIGRRLIPPTIIEAEDRGLVDCHRAGLRIATTYTLNWLPLPDGQMPIERWRNYRSHNNLVHEGEPDSASECATI
jgi:hypothetical protein